MSVFRVAKEDAGKRVDVWLAGAARISRAEIQRMITADQVIVDGQPVKPSMKVSAGQEVSISPSPDRDPSIQAVHFDTRYEDDHILVVNKPPGLVVHPAPGTNETTLVEALSRSVNLADTGDSSRPGIVHRLDRDTSGLLVVAKTREAYLQLVEAMKRRMIRREYFALVAGTFDKQRGRIEAPVGRSERNRTRMGVTPLGRQAVTDFVVEEKLGPVSLVRAQILTGRTHQIRVHFAHIGHPVVGDPSYGRTAETLARDLGLSRPFLHAAEISFFHPITNEELTITEALPADLAQALDRARLGANPQLE